MELTTSQKSAFISEMLSSESGINELIRILLNTFSKQERSLLSKSIKENSAMVSVPVDGGAMDVALSFAFHVLVQGVSSP